MADSWKCPHCGNVHPLSQQIWLARESRKEGGMFIGFVSSKTPPCPSCGVGVDIQKLTDGEYDVGSSKCFIATAACGSADSPDVLALREFRDRVLQSRLAGRSLIAFYYRISPRIADWISRRDRIRLWVRRFIVAPAAAWARTCLRAKSR